MIEDRQNMTKEELVDILAQKTERVTQLLLHKDLRNEYKECKETIRQMLAEIELRKENNKQNTDPILKQYNSTVQ